MPLGNYREIPMELNGATLSIGGFKRPNGEDVFQTLREQHSVEAVISLSGDYTDFLTRGGMNPAYYTHGPTVEVKDYFGVPYEDTQRIEPIIYDNVYHAVSSAQALGLKIAIHCGAGDGRTGTALASLKLREILEEEYKKESSNFDDPVKMQKTESIHVHMGALSGPYVPCDVSVTSNVKLAIESVRKYDNPADFEGPHESVETLNDVESLQQYETHLRKEFALRKVHVQDIDAIPAAMALSIAQAADELIEQQEAALLAVFQGEPQPSVSFVSSLIKGIASIWQFVNDDDYPEVLCI